MRRIVITQKITLDGVIDNNEGWFDVTTDTEQGMRQRPTASWWDGSPSKGVVLTTYAL
jgi:hypothetical protein